MPTSLSQQIIDYSTDMKISDYDKRQIQQLVSLINSTVGYVSPVYSANIIGISGYPYISGFFSTGIDYSAQSESLKITENITSRSIYVVRAIAKYFDERVICDHICRYKKHCIVPDDIIVRSIVSPGINNPFVYELKVQIEISLERLDADLLAILRNKQKYSINLLQDEIKVFYNNVTQAASGTELEEFLAWKASRSAPVVTENLAIGSRKVKV